MCDETRLSKAPLCYSTMTGCVTRIEAIMIIVHVLRSLCLEPVQGQGEGFHEMWSIINEFHHIWGEVVMWVTDLEELLEALSMLFLWLTLLLGVMPSKAFSVWRNCSSVILHWWFRLQVWTWSGNFPISYTPVPNLRGIQATVNTPAYCWTEAVSLTWQVSHCEGHVDTCLLDPVEPDLL